MTATRTRGMPQVGDHVEVYWPHDQCYYAGRVSHVNTTRDTFRVNYDDGDVENLKLEFEEWRYGPHQLQPLLPTSPVDIREGPDLAHTALELDYCNNSLELVAVAVRTFQSHYKQRQTASLRLRHALDILLAAASDPRLAKALRKGLAVERKRFSYDERKVDLESLKNNFGASTSAELRNMATIILHCACSLKREKCENEILHAAAIVLSAMQVLKQQTL